MGERFKTVDLFAGPGGLAEGFSSLRDSADNRIFDIALSVEKEPSAFATLRLRAFTRQFRELPNSYYQYIKGDISREALIDSYPVEWAAAVHETALLELGTSEAAADLGPRRTKQVKRITVEAGNPFLRTSSCRANCAKVTLDVVAGRNHKFHSSSAPFQAQMSSAR